MRIYFVWLLIAAGIAALVAYRVEDELQWRVFVHEHRCLPIAEAPASRVYGSQPGTNIMETIQHPRRTLWRCANGEEYVK